MVWLVAWSLSNWSQFGGGTTYSFLVLTKGGMNDAHVEKDLARVGNLVEFGDGIVKLIVVVASERGNPRLDFLCCGECLMLSACCCSRTCFNDMAAAAVTQFSLELAQCKSSKSRSLQNDESIFRDF